MSSLAAPPATSNNLPTQNSAAGDALIQQNQKSTGQNLSRRNYQENSYNAYNRYNNLNQNNYQNNSRYNNYQNSHGNNKLQNYRSRNASNFNNHRNRNFPAMTSNQGRNFSNGQKNYPRNSRRNFRRQTSGSPQNSANSNQEDSDMNNTGSHSAGSNSGTSNSNNHSNGSTDNGILDSKILQIINKRYYLDVKEHQYGRFLKIAEAGNNGNKSRMVVPVYLLPEFDRVINLVVAKLKELPEFQLPDDGASGDHGNIKKKSVAAIEYFGEIIERGKRRYYFNLKENTRGRYLRIKATGDIPKTFPGVRKRLNVGEVSRAIVLPVIGIDSFQQKLQELNSSHGVDVATDKVALADQLITENGRESDRLLKSMRITSKKFKKVVFIDAGKNGRGSFARITEQVRSNRESTTIPAANFKEVGEWFLKAAELIPEEEKLQIEMEKKKIEEARKLRLAEKNGEKNSAESSGENKSESSNFRRENASEDDAN